MKGEWMLSAACRGVGGDFFFPPNNDDRSDVPTGYYNQARKVCERCPVRPECLEAVLDMEQGLSVHSRHGIWAGFSPHERKAIEKSGTRPDLRLTKRGV